MSKFAYTAVAIIRGNKGDKIIEQSGILEALSAEHVVLELTRQGYMVKEVYMAQAEDLMIDRLRQRRKRLIGIPDLSIIPIQELVVRPRRRRLFLLTFLLILLGIVAIGMMLR
jgi:hypothetical protein